MRVHVLSVSTKKNSWEKLKKVQEKRNERRRLTAVVGDEYLADEAGAAAGQHVVLKLDLCGSHCERRGHESVREMCSRRQHCGVKPG